MLEPFAYGVLFHLCPFANFRGGQSLRFQEYGQTPHPETVFLSQTVSFFEFHPLGFV